MTSNISKSYRSKVASAYSQAQIQTSNPGKRVVMLYDGIIKNLEQALHLLSRPLEPNDLIQVNHHLQLAEKIILELQLALDMERGGEISKNLFRLYEFWMEKISESNVYKSNRQLDAILEMVKTLRDTWEEASKKYQPMTTNTGS